MKISSWKGSTALHIASYRGMYYICRILIENGAKIDIENDQGLLPLQIYAKDPLAVEGGREERLRDVEDLLKGFEEVSTSICNNLPTYDDVVAKVARVHEAMNIQARQILDKVRQNIYAFNRSNRIKVVCLVFYFIWQCM